MNFARVILLSRVVRGLGQRGQKQKSGSSLHLGGLEGGRQTQWVRMRVKETRAAQGCSAVASGHIYTNDNQSPPPSSPLPCPVLWSSGLLLSSWEAC